MECAHREVQKDVQASSSLGKARDAVSICSGGVIAAAKRRHREAFGLRTTGRTRTGKARTRRRRAMSRCLRLAEGTPLKGRYTNGYFMFKSQEQKACGNAGLGRFVGVESREHECKSKWRALPLSERKRYSYMARCQNQVWKDERLEAAAAAAASGAAAAAQPNARGPWGQGDASGIITSGDLLEASSKYQMFRSDAVQLLKEARGARPQASVAVAWWVMTWHPSPSPLPGGLVGLVQASVSVVLCVCHAASPHP